ncbi:MAG: hypothetical protein ACK5M3_10630 [Dysgonomonas sp.]
MKKIILSICFILTTSLLFSQQQSDPLQYMQGLEQGENQFFQLGDYVFNVVTANKKYSEKEMNKVLKRYNVKNPQKKYSDENFGPENTIMESEAQSKQYADVTEFQKFYFFPIGEKKMKFIVMQTMIQNSSLEEAFINAYNNNTLDKYIVCNTNSTRTLNFLGREIKLGAPGNWMFVNNLQSPGNGQMNWAVYPSMEEAHKRTLLQMRQNEERKILKNEEVKVVFEGEPTTATRILYKMNVPRMIMGGSNNLAVYYVTAKVRDQYVSCVLSNFVENENDYTLGALLQEVMEPAE